MGDEKYTFKFNNKELFISKIIKYLGFILSDNGSQRSHADEIIKRGRVAMSAIFRNPTIMGIKNLKMHKRIFNTKILPVIEYEVEKRYSNWSPFSSSIIKECLVYIRQLIHRF